MKNHEHQYTSMNNHVFLAKRVVFQGLFGSLEGSLVHVLGGSCTGGHRFRRLEAIFIHFPCKEAPSRGVACYLHLADALSEFFECLEELKISNVVLKEPGVMLGGYYSIGPLGRPGPTVGMTRGYVIMNHLIRGWKISVGIEYCTC